MSPIDPIEPDRVIQTALRLLPAPQHGETFWGDLEQAIDGHLVATGSASARADSPDGQRVPERVELDRAVDDALALVPLAFRRRSNAVVLAVASAAVILVVFAGSSLVRERSDGEKVLIAGTGDTVGASGALNALVDGAHPSSSTLVTVSARTASASTDAVAAWVDAVHAGDAAAAWLAMGPASQDHFGSQNAFREQLAVLDSELGAWSGVEPDEVLVTPVIASDDSTVAVVTMVGTTQDASGAQLQAHAFPVRIVDGDAVLEPFAPAGELEVVMPEPMSETGALDIVERGDELVIVVPQGVDAPILRLDGGATVVCGKAEGTALRVMDALPMQRCSYLPDAGIAPGAHTLTVAFMGSDGATISAEALLFEAA